MALLWLFFALILLLAEPLFLNRWFASLPPERAIALLQRLHWVLLLLSLLILMGAVAGAHGLFQG